MTQVSSWGTNRAGKLPRLLFPLLVLLVGAPLFFCRLDDVYLWQDEAETAIVSRNLLAFGLPLSTDGRNWVQQAGGSFVEFTADYVWLYHSWLQYALAAVSFGLLGPTTLAARLPFALFGLATVALLYRLVLHWVADERVARVAIVLLVLCVPFALLLRQCRYYAPSAFFTLLMLDAYLHLRGGTQWGIPYLVLAAVLLYHSHYGAFFPSVIALGVDMLVSRERRDGWRRFLIALVLITAFVLPWAHFMRVLYRGQPFRLDRFAAHVGQHVVYITAWVFPLVLVALLLIAWGRSQRGGELALSPQQAGFCRLASIVVVINVLMLSAAAAFDWVFFRYIAHLIPLLLAMLAIVIVLVMERWPVGGYGLLALLLVCNGLHMLPYGLPGVRDLEWSGLWSESGAFQALDEVWNKAGRFRSSLWMYAQELTHSYDGPNEGLIGYLLAHARPGQTLLVNYEDLPLMFYTDLRVLGGLSGHGLSDGVQPDWVVDRKHGSYRDQLAAVVGAGSYERIEIPYPDIRWENRPEPGGHHYLTVQGEENVVLYRRQED